jgi:SlyX protein
MTDDRFEAIETKLAHQEALLIELNDTITQQQQTITQLEALCDSIRLRVRSMADAMPADAEQDERPPHY